MNQPDTYTPEDRLQFFEALRATEYPDDDAPAHATHSPDSQNAPHSPHSQSSTHALHSETSRHLVTVQDSLELPEGYPAPIHPDAYHGLAGEIVRMIDPHTEADPVAVLINLLAGFGSIVGRSPHMIADGARHGTNLFGVLAGESAKARKGSSWNQVRRLLERVDPDWLLNCVKSGLNSGEGLIYHVRDARTALVEETGRPGEPVKKVVEPGVEDKRLFAIEEEFASILKVMSREANVLSPIIRSAWDGCNLSSLTKNQPVKATDPHISIIGHITTRELHHYLHETEIGNGFANRFFWAAVHRSKELPEGGEILSVDFDPVIDRLRSAVEFARQTGRIVRSETARSLWRAAYSGLSAGQPGILGSVTARSEAQVMRFSMLYALLDESDVILPEHHFAAMALWDYCVASAQFLFGTVTGDKNADKIIAALKLAGSAGMIRTEIMNDVFKRHISAHVLDGTLQLLRRMKQAVCISEYNAGNYHHRERWFAAGNCANAANVAHPANVANAGW